MSYRLCVISGALLCLVSACGRKAPHEGKSVAELEAMLAGDDPTLQAQGAHGLALLGAEARSAVPALAKTLKSKGTLARQTAARALGEIGPAAAAAAPALIEALGDPEWQVRRQAATALGQIGTAARSATPALSKLRHDAQALVRSAAEEALKKVGR
jgi:HEAT repeat protein